MLGSYFGEHLAEQGVSGGLGAIVKCPALVACAVTTGTCCHLLSHMNGMGWDGIEL